MSLPPLPDGVSFACPVCGADVREDGSTIRCANGHVAGSTNGLTDFRGQREGVDRRLADFWGSSPDYYEEARQANLDYDDEGHGSHRAVIAELHAARSATVLDVGCGTGELATELAARLPIASYVGLDVSPLAVRTAVELGRPGTFLAGDAERLPFSTGSFDAVVSLYALEHFAAPELTLSELCRVLRPGGTLALLSLSYDRPWGTVPSIRLGLVWRGRRVNRWNPANLVVYVLNRLRYAIRQTAKQLRYTLDSRYTSFELVAHPLVLDQGYAIDRDAVHVVSGRSVQRALEREGIVVSDSSLGSGWRSLRIPFDLRIVGRKAQWT